MWSALGEVLARLAQRLRLYRLRLPRMLRRRGIKVRAYLSTLSPHEVRQHVHNCAKCGAALGDLCDRDLKGRTPCKPGAFSYCPNRDAVQRYLARKRSK